MTRSSAQQYTTAYIYIYIYITADLFNAILNNEKFFRHSLGNITTKNGISTTPLKVAAKNLYKNYSGIKVAL